jgi:hypothetical protein
LACERHSLALRPSLFAYFGPIDAPVAAPREAPFRRLDVLVEKHIGEAHLTALLGLFATVVVTVTVLVQTFFASNLAGGPSIAGFFF